MRRNMPKSRIYKWQGINNNGEKMSGEQNAFDVHHLRFELRTKGIFLKKSQLKISFFNQKKISYQDITLFTRQWTTLLQAGVPILQALSWIIKINKKSAAKNLLEEIKASLEKGSAVSEALMQHPQCFDAIYCNLVAVGEQSGTLDKLIDRLANYREKQQAVKNKINKALFYPVLVLVIAMLALSIMLLIVVPQFQNLFAGFHAELPWPTQWAIYFSQAFKKMLMYFFLSVVLSLLLWIYLRQKYPKLNFYRDKLLLHLPVIKMLLQKSTAALFAKTIATALAGGIPIVSAMQMVANAIKNRVYQQEILYLSEQLANGQSLQVALQQKQLFPLILIEMVAIGEQSGKLETMLDKSANLMDAEIDVMVDTLTALIEPVLMVVLGLIIGTLLIAMYLPIFRLGNLI